jgi:hypothetical protein
MDSVRTTLLGDKGYKGMVLFSEEVSIMEEVTNTSQDIFTNKRPVFLVEGAVKPSGPGALEEPRLERAWSTSYLEGMEQRDRLSSIEIMGEKDPTFHFQ